MCLSCYINYRDTVQGSDCSCLTSALAFTFTVKSAVHLSAACTHVNIDIERLIYWAFHEKHPLVPL